MDNETLTVKEKTQGIWKIASIGSGILCVIFFLIYWNLTDPFWAGIFRLGAFIFFALAMLGLLKLMNGPLQISLSSTEQLFLVSYTKKDKVVKEEQFERSTIKKITVDKPSGNLLVSYLQPNSVSFKISFTDTDRNLHLFEFGGRPLLFGPETQHQIKEFVRGLDIDA